MSGWTYMLRCSDDSLYVGSTSHADVETRLAEHNDAKYLGYTAFRRPVYLMWARYFDDLRDAHNAERRIKGWSRAKKQALIAGDEQHLIALSARRAGAPVDRRPKKSNGTLRDEAHATGTLSVPTKSPRNSLFRSSTARSAEQAQAAKHRQSLIVARSRHPEVRAQRAPKDEP